MEAKSVITFPSGGQTLPAPGLYELTGLAWSGRGRIERVEITTRRRTDLGAGELQEPRLPIALTRFRLPWRFDGRDAVIASRAIDETGYVQPTREALIAVRGTNSIYHFNGIKFWRVQRRRDRDQCGRVAASCSLAAAGDAWRRSRRVRRRTAADAGRDPRLGAAIAPDGTGLPQDRGRSRRAATCSRRSAPAVMDPKGEGDVGREARRRTGHARDAAATQDRRQLLAVRDDAVGLHQSRDAVRSARAC